MTNTSAPDLLKTLAEARGFPSISAYFPTHPTFPDSEQDPIRLGNARREIAKQLESAGWDGGEIEKLLSEMKAREEDEEYWKYQDEGLAVFLDGQETRWVKLPKPVEEITVVAERFHVRPLIRAFRDHGSYYVLTVTEDNARLYNGDSRSLKQVPVEDLPDGTDKIRGMTDFDANVGFHSRDRAVRRGDSGAGPKYAALGDSPEEYEEVILEQYLQQVAKAVDAHLANARDPLVIVAVPRTAGRLKDELDYAGVVTDLVTSDPASLDEGQLREKAHAVAEPILLKARDEIRDTLNARMKNGEPTYAKNLEQILRATEEGRIDTLFLDPDSVVWGIYDESKRVMRRDTQDGPDNEDLINLAALRTLAQGGDVRAMPDELKDSTGGLVALYRY